MTKHIVIPDVQVRPGSDMSFLPAIGNFIVEQQPDVVVNIGDFADMPSLSTYDYGKKEFEGRRYINDIESVHAAQSLLLSPLRQLQAQQKRNKKKLYEPKLHLTLGNHEHRINRAVSSDSKLHGLLRTDDLKYHEFGWEVHPFLVPVDIDGIRYCLAPHHRVLTKSLEYIPLGSIEVGQEIIGFDENLTIKGRKFKTGVVTKKTVTPAKVMKVTLSNGKEFTATPDHRWLILEDRVCWKHTFELVVGTKIPKYFDEWDEIKSKDAGWLAGMFDGEGHISKPNSTQGGIQLGISQNPGIVRNKLEKLLDELGSLHKETDDGNCITTRILGTSADKIKLLGQIRPERLVSKFKPEMLGRMQKIDVVTVVAIEELQEEQDIVQIETSTGTLIVDGYAHHNCHYFTSGVMGNPAASAKALLRAECRSSVMGHVQKREVEVHPKTNMTAIFVGSCYTDYQDYLGPQGNLLTPGIWVFDNVRNGIFDYQFISLDRIVNDYS